MTDPSRERPPLPPDQATRDIRLPSLPGRPPPAVPPEWTSYVPADQPAADGVAPRRGGDEPTDRLASPSGPARKRTLSFRPPPAVQLLKVSVTPRRRRTGRVLWALFFLILAVIVASGVYLVITVAQR
jgi:hypothetical protein